MFTGTVFWGLIFGISQFLPVSDWAHSYLFRYLTGLSDPTALQQLMICLGSLAALLLFTYQRLAHIRRELKHASLPKARRKRVVDMLAVADFKLVLTATVPMMLCLIARQRIASLFPGLVWLCVSLIISGILLYLPQFMTVGNRDSRNFNPLQGLLLGLCCGFSVIPGLSLIAILLYFTRAQHCQREYCYELALLYSFPVLICKIVICIIGCLSASALQFSGMDFLSGIIAAVAAFGGGLAAIRFMRYLAVTLDFHGFALYQWGLAVFCFIYYLMT